MPFFETKYANLRVGGVVAGSMHPTTRSRDVGVVNSDSDSISHLTQHLAQH
jgi:hypothetical protein